MPHVTISTQGRGGTEYLDWEVLQASFTVTYATGSAGVCARSTVLAETASVACVIQLHKRSALAMLTWAGNENQHERAVLQLVSKLLQV